MFIYMYILYIYLCIYNSEISCSMERYFSDLNFGCFSDLKNRKTCMNILNFFLCHIGNVFPGVPSTTEKYYNLCIQIWFSLLLCFCAYNILFVCLVWFFWL